MKKNVLVIGGAGYIGSHMVCALYDAGHQVTTFDNLDRGHRDAVLYGEFVKGDLADREALRKVFATSAFDVVMHFAAHAWVGESVQNPRLYYRNNVVGTLNLLEAMIDASVQRLVFSSTCATFGEVPSGPITEDLPQAPVNPYGYSKLVIERALTDFAAPHGLRSVSLRYFNAAGADPKGRVSERHEPETHLIPLVLNEARRIKNGGSPKESKLKVFGTDYPTPDGTCLRDYVHVTDLCDAHLLAAARLERGEVNGAEFYNLGTEKGYSVLEVIQVASEVTGVEIPYTNAPRRPGDPPALIASSSRATEILGWSPKYNAPRTIIETAWKP